MDAAVKNLGYVVVETDDLDAWRRFGTDLCGMQLHEVSEGRLRFRVDSKEFRIEVRAGERNAICVLGWEVPGPAELAELAGRLDRAGFLTTPGTPEQVGERKVIDLLRFSDPDGTAELELFYGMTESLVPFSSPNGTRFVTGQGGLGHVLQIVQDTATHWHLYVDVLGMRLSDVIWSPKRQTDLTFLHAGPRHHSMAFAAMEGVAPAFGHLMLEVDSLDAVGYAYDKVLDGAAELITTFGKHTNDQMLSFYMRTPSDFGLEFGTGGLEIDRDTWVPVRYEDAHYWGHHRAVPVNLADPADVE